jgi:hypothetical protein
MTAWHLLPEDGNAESEPDIPLEVSGLSFSEYGGACPYQAEGRTSFGSRFYFRFRFNSAQLSVWDAADTDTYSDPLLYAEINDVFPGDDLIGTLTNSEARDLIIKLIGLLAPPQDWAHGTHQQRLIAALRNWRTNREAK